MKKVVIIGGGFAGSLIAKELEGEFDVTLIDTKDYFEFTPSILRTIVEPKHAKKIQVLHNHYLKKTRILRGCVTSIGKDIVSLEDGKKIEFDYLAIASGSKYKEIFKEENVVLATRGQHLLQRYKEMVKAKDIVIVGGGLVGVELAAEFAEKCNGKKNITLIHSKDKLIERNPVKASKKAERFLKKRGIKILFNEKAIKNKNKIFFTNKGREVKADLAFLSIGISPNSESFKKSFARNLDKNGFVRVDENLRVPGLTNVFACGDIASIREEKTAQSAEKHAETVVHNIKSLEEKGLLKEYKHKHVPLIISLGKWDAILVDKEFVLSGFIPAMLKSWIEKWYMRKYR